MGLLDDAGPDIPEGAPSSSLLDDAGDDAAEIGAAGPHGMTPTTDELGRPGNSLVQPVEYRAQPTDWSDTLLDAGIGLGEGVSRGLGVNPGRAAGFLAEKGAQVRNFLGGGDTDPQAFGREAEQSARGLLADAHARSPMATGMAEAAGEMAPGLAAMAATGGAVNPITMGVASGVLSGLGNSEADSLGGMALDAGEGGLYGGLAGGAAKLVGGAGKLAGRAGQWFGGLADDVANSPMTKRAAQWAGAGTGGSLGSAVGSVFGAPGTAAGGFLGAAAGGAAAERAAPAAIRGMGNAVRQIGTGAAQAGSDPRMQAFAATAAAQQAGRSLERDDTPEKATNAGRGNLLGEAALEALQSNPSTLGDYQAEFAKAAASPETGAVNALIVRLAQKDPAFRAGPMVELQRMTAEY